MANHSPPAERLKVILLRLKEILASDQVIQGLNVPQVTELIDYILDKIKNVLNGKEGAYKEDITLNLSELASLFISMSFFCKKDNSGDIQKLNEELSEN